MPPMNSAFSATVSHRDDDSAIVTVSGELDISTAPALKSVLDELCGNGRLKVIVDLSGMSFIDSSGLGLLVKTLKLVRQRTGASLKIINASANVHNVIQIAKLDSMLGVAAP